MSTIVIGCDSNGVNDRAYQSTVASMMRKAGHKTIELDIAPGPFADYSYSSNAKGKIGIYIIAAGTNSISDLAFGGTQFDYAYFIIRGDLGNSRMDSEDDFNKNPIGADPDCKGNCTRLVGKTFPQMNELTKSKCLTVYGGTAEQGANNVLALMGNPQQGTGLTGSGSSGTSQGASNVSPLLEGEMTFEELVGEICKGIDLMFLCKRSTVVVTDFSTIFAEAQYLRQNHYASVSDEDVKVWQLEEDSYELNVNHHAFYNTVYVNYKNGTVKEQFGDLAYIYGEVPITYDDKKLDKTTAQMKAKAYLAAHLRDFELSIEATILTEPNIDIGDIVTLKNPHPLPKEAKSSEGGLPEYLFVKGVNTNWEGDGYITSDIELQFSPTSPAKKEVPTAGTLGTTNNQPDE